MKKDKNTLSVALKSSKKETTVKAKAFEKKLSAVEKQVADLSEFKSKKLQEEREEKLRKKKEMKKARKKFDELTAKKQAGTEINYSLIDVAESKTYMEHKEGAIENKSEMKQIGTEVKGIDEEDAIEKDLEDVNCMSDKDFAEHLWMKFWGRPRPAKYSCQQESVSDELGDGRDRDDS